MDSKKFLKIFGKRLQLLRKSKRISQEMLAELTELHPTYISKMERGIVNPSILILRKISRALNISLLELFNIHAKKESEKDSMVEEITILLRKLNINSLIFIKNLLFEFNKLMKT